MKIIWLGHSGFRIEIEDVVLLVDPWMTDNPMFPAEKRGEAIAGATHVFLTHAHGDHAADAVSVADELDIPVYAIHELSLWLADQGVKQAVGFGKGGTVSAGAARITMVNAVHSASIDFGEGGLKPGGSPAGFMIAGEGHTIYLSGDTDIMADMGWMAEYHRPDIGILCAGGHYTMDMERAAWAARKYFNFRWLIPSHYRTFPLLEQNADKLRVGVPPGVEVIEPEVLTAIEL